MKTINFAHYLMQISEFKMNKKNLTTDILIVVALILVLVVMRLANITVYKFHLVPMAAISLFAGFVLRRKSLALLVPFGAYLVTDLYLEITNAAGGGFYGISQVFVYVGMMLVALLGTQLKRLKAMRVLGFTIGGSLLFWLVSNLGVFAAGYYGYSFSGFVNTYIAALPFVNNEIGTQLFFNAVFSDLICSAIIFGVGALIQKSVSVRTVR